MQITPRSVVFLAVLSLGACRADSPTSTDAAIVQAAATLQSKERGTCVFTTPNGKTHTSSSSKCKQGIKDVAGSYQATTLLLTQDGETFDLIAGGATIRLTLNSDGTTSGHFYAPANPDEPGSGMDVDLTGTWRLDNGQITLQHNGDSIIREITYTVQDGRLVGFGDDIGEDCVQYGGDPCPVDLEVVFSRI